MAKDKKLSPGITKVLEAVVEFGCQRRRSLLPSLQKPLTDRPLVTSGDIDVTFQVSKGYFHSRDTKI
jgi:hypothetical protein